MGTEKCCGWSSFLLKDVCHDCLDVDVDVCVVFCFNLCVCVMCFCYSLSMFTFVSVCGPICNYKCSGYMA